MKKIIVSMIAFLVLAVTSAFADWTVTTNYTGKYSAKITFVCTPCSNVVETNFNLSKGFLRGKQTPQLTWTTIISNVGSTQQITNAVILTTVGTPEICHWNATNISVRVRKNTSLAVKYIKFIAECLLPHSIIK